MVVPCPPEPPSPVCQKNRQNNLGVSKTAKKIAKKIARKTLVPEKLCQQNIA
ncbi:MAG: hypothetical protein HC780_07375 [Leptolyngbyaceae cyanobacterium CSU_1_3]|nr:hypothetical protein [Leptolyngbyaceae cyanobacterium CSU_1_3]